MAKKSSFGAKLQRLVTATWTDIAQIKDLNGPGLSGETTDVTTHDSTDGFREHLGTLRDGGELSFDVEFDPEETAGQAYLLTSYKTGVTIDLHLVFKTANNHTWAFSGIVTKFEPKNPVAGSIQASISLKLTGSPNFNWSA